jgi:hypothetical protein
MCADLKHDKSTVVLGSFKVPDALAHEPKSLLDELMVTHPIAQTYCSQLGQDYVLQVGGEASAKALAEPKNILVEQIDPIKVTAVPVGKDEYAICVSDPGGLFKTAAGESIVKDFKDSLITGVPVFRKSWVHEFHDHSEIKEPASSASMEPLAWHKRLYENYQFRQEEVPLVSAPHLVLFDSSFNTQLTRVAVNYGVTKFAVMTCLYDLFLQTILKVAPHYILGSPILLREVDVPLSAPVHDYCLLRSVADPVLDYSKNFEAMFHAIQASLIHHVPVDELLKQYENKGKWLYDYLIAYYPKGLVDSDVIETSHDTDQETYFNELMPFTGAQAGLLVVEFYDDFGVRFSLDASRYTQAQALDLGEDFKRFVLQAI